MRALEERHLWYGTAGLMGMGNGDAGTRITTTLTVPHIIVCHKLGHPREAACRAGILHVCSSLRYSCGSLAILRTHRVLDRKPKEKESQQPAVQRKQELGCLAKSACSSRQNNCIALRCRSMQVDVMEG